MAELIEIKLTTKQREELEAIVSRSSERAGLVRRARAILLTDAGESGRENALRLDLSPEHVSKLRRRFYDEGVAGLAERPKAGRKDHAVPAETIDRIVQLAMSPPPAGRRRTPGRCRSGGDAGRRGGSPGAPGLPRRGLRECRRRRRWRSVTEDGKKINGTVTIKVKNTSEMIDAYAEIDLGARAEDDVVLRVARRHLGEEDAAAQPVLARTRAKTSCSSRP